jgi:hypothetical protein
MAGSLVLPAVAFSQQEAPELEEVVVTGSFIRNSAFAQNNPVDTVSQADIRLLVHLTWATTSGT